MREMGQREVWLPAQDGTAGRWECHDPTGGSQGSERTAQDQTDLEAIRFTSRG